MIILLLAAAGNLQPAPAAAQCNLQYTAVAVQGLRHVAGEQQMSPLAPVAATDVNTVVLQSQLDAVGEGCNLGSPMVSAVDVTVVGRLEDVCRPYQVMRGGEGGG
jgi:hypothetical protein